MNCTTHSVHFAQVRTSARDVSRAKTLTGPAALGIWYSRYYPYGEQSYTSQIIDEYKANALPLSVGVLDVR